MILLIRISRGGRMMLDALSLPHNSNLRPFAPLALAMLCDCDLARSVGFASRLLRLAACGCTQIRFEGSKHMLDELLPSSTTALGFPVVSSGIVHAFAVACCQYPDACEMQM